MNRLLVATTRSWDGGGGADTDWTTDVNWTSNIEPVASDTAEFDRGFFVYTVTFPLLFPAGDITTDRLIVGSNTVTFEPDHSNTDYIAGTTDTSETGRGIIIGEEADDFTATLISHLGLLSTAAATLGQVAGSSGTLTLNQNNDQFNVNGNSGSNTELIIGRYGTGVLNVSGGADVNGSSADVRLGYHTGSNGTAIINGTGSTLTAGGFLFVGTGGNGTLDITAGGVVTSGRGNIAVSFGSSGEVTVDGSGSTWNNTDSLYVGDSGTGTLNVTDGGNVSSDVAILGFSGDGHATVTGAGSTWTITDFLDVGRSGHGTLDITAGGVVTNVDARIGFFAGSAGEATVDGTGSRWTTTAGISVGIDGTGTLTVTNGGTVEAPGLGVGSSGEVHGDGNIVGGVQNAGLVSPGTSPGALSIDGDFTQIAGGKLLIELAWVSSYDKLLVTNNATLAGKLEVKLLNGYAPSSGHTFDVLDWGGTLTGTFTSLVLPGLTSNLVWNTTNLYTTGVISVVLPGDYNLNGVVDAADYVVWRKTDGTPAGYNTWRTHFGQTAGGGSGSGLANHAVPEPTGRLALLIGTLAIFIRRRAVAS